jgi:TM2 domain-containing membrane protein YozV
MEQSKINSFTVSHGNKFSIESLILVQRRLKEIDDNKLTVILAQNYKEPDTIFLISLFLGFFGVDRFMLGHIGLGIAKLCYPLLHFGLIFTLLVLISIDPDWMAEIEAEPWEWTDTLILIIWTILIIIWWFIDLFLTRKTAKAINLEKFMKATMF